MSETSLPSRTCCPLKLTSPVFSVTMDLVSTLPLHYWLRTMIKRGYAVLTEQVAGGIVVPGSGCLVSLLGVDDLIVVDMPDTLLVTTRARSQEVKRLVKKCKDAGWKQLL